MNLFLPKGENFLLCKYPLMFRAIRSGIPRYQVVVTETSSTGQWSVLVFCPHFPYSEAKISQENTSCVRERRGSIAVSLVVGDSEVHTAVKRRFAVALRPDSERCPEILWQAARSGILMSLIRPLSFLWSSWGWKERGKKKITWSVSNLGATRLALHCKFWMCFSLLAVWMRN